MKQLSKEQIKELRSALSFWRDDYDRDDDAEQYNMFDNVMAAMDMLLAGMTQDPVGSHHFDSKALELSRRVMAIMYGPMPIGGSVQLQAQVQCLFVGAMQYAASPAPVVPDGYVLVPVELLEELSSAANFEKVSYAAAFNSHLDTGRWKDEYEDLERVCRDVNALLPAPPKEV